jgi:hypothetical protein
MDFADRSLRADPPKPTPQDPHGWFYREGLGFKEAQCFLDWLEASGIGEREVALEPAGTFRVRWREGP